MKFSKHILIFIGIMSPVMSRKGWPPEKTPSENFDDWLVKAQEEYCYLPVFTNEGEPMNMNTFRELVCDTKNYWRERKNREMFTENMRHFAEHHLEVCQIISKESISETETDVGLYTIRREITLPLGSKFNSAQSLECPSIELPEYGMVKFWPTIQVAEDGLVKFWPKESGSLFNEIRDIERRPRKNYSCSRAYQYAPVEDTFLNDLKQVYRTEKTEDEDGDSNTDLKQVYRTEKTEDEDGDSNVSIVIEEEQTVEHSYFSFGDLSTAPEPGREARKLKAAEEKSAVMKKKKKKKKKKIMKNSRWTRTLEQRSKDRYRGVRRGTHVEQTESHHHVLRELTKRLLKSEKTDVKLPKGFKKGQKVYSLKKMTSGKWTIRRGTQGMVVGVSCFPGYENNLTVLFKTSGKKGGKKYSVPAALISQNPPADPVSDECLEKIYAIASTAVPASGDSNHD